MWVELHSNGKPSLVQLSKVDLVKPDSKKSSITNIVFNNGETITVDENYEQLKKMLGAEKVV